MLSRLYNKKMDQSEKKKKTDPGLKNQLVKLQTVNQIFNINKELQENLEKKQIEINKIKVQMEMQKRRFAERQLEYRKIIQDLQNKIKQSSNLDKCDIEPMKQINHLHQQIQLNITNIQKKTSKILIQQESDIIRFFNKRIDQAKEKFKKERMDKGQKDQEYIQKEKQLMYQLDWIKNIAQKIDNQNHNLMKKYMELKSQYQIQENDRQMLFKQLIMKKKKNAILKAQIEQYQKLLEQCSKQIQEVQEPAKSNSSFPNNKSIRNEDRQQNTIKILKNTLSKQQKRYRELQKLYVKEIQNKTELQKILRDAVDDIKDEIIKIRGNIRSKHQQGMTKQKRQKLIERLLTNQKILTLIYDKTFYSQIQKIQLEQQT